MGREENRDIGVISGFSPTQNGHDDHVGGIIANCRMGWVKGLVCFAIFRALVTTKGARGRMSAIRQIMAEPRSSRREIEYRGFSLRQA